MVKKQLIMEKALELFAKQGFEATSVQQITEHCGISKGAFYLSFKSKDELILALIDHFMQQIISDIDYIVRNTKHDKLLHEFYFVTYHSFYKHLDFTKILIKEQAQTLNTDLIVKIRYYDRQLDKIILSMVEQIYGDQVSHSKYDLVYSIKGFMKTYADLFYFYNMQFDLDKLSTSLVEKTNLLATQTRLPFVTQDMIDMFQVPMIEAVSKEELVDIIDRKIDEIDDSIEKESLSLLKNHIFEPTLNLAIVKGLLGNIRQHPHCKWIYFLMSEYLGV